MATVTVDINGKPYTVGCADGQEERVRALAAQFDDTVRQVARDVGMVGELRLFLMAALMVGDEMSDLRGQISRLSAEQDRARSEGGAAVLDDVAKAINRAADRIEKLTLEAS